MDRRKSKSKSVKRRSSMKHRGKGILDLPSLPAPDFAFEDVLVTQLPVNDVLNNCIHGDNEGHGSFERGINDSANYKRKQSFIYHRCYNDTTYTPLWHAFSCLDSRTNDHVLLGRVMNLSSSLSSVLGENHHSDAAVQQQFIDFPRVKFEQYKEYVLDTTSHIKINSERLCAICWTHCKNKYLQSSLVDSLEPVVPIEQCEALYWLFCIFNRLTEPGTYPPAMDYEETELLLRKLHACLDIPWTSTPEDALFNEDLDKEDYEPSVAPLVNFQHLLSVIADMVGVEAARTHHFYRAAQRLCLIEYQDVVKTGWVNVRKSGGEGWKKRWAVLQGSTLTCYVTVLCDFEKEKIFLDTNRHVELLPGISSHKYRFRVVEKEGFSIKCEYEFSVSDSKSSQSWVSLINITIRVSESGMSAKASEISERRLERFRRRESVREVYRKKRDVVETVQRLEEAKKKRREMEDNLSQRAQEREAQMVYLEKLEKIYERLESIQYQKRLRNKEEREKRLSKLYANYEECLRLGCVFDNSCIPSSLDKNLLQDLNSEETELEKELEVLKQTSFVLSSSIGSPMITFHPPQRSASVDHCHTYSSSSDNMSTGSK